MLKAAYMGPVVPAVEVFMSPRRLVLLSLLATLALAAHGRPNPVAASKDPQAVQILTQCVNALGGAVAIAAVQDSTGTGTIT